MFSEEAMLASRDFMTSVVVGKDAVPRIGMHQAETLRFLVMRIIVMIELFHHKGQEMLKHLTQMTNTKVIYAQARPDGDDQEVRGKQMDDDR